MPTNTPHTVTLADDVDEIEAVDLRLQARLALAHALVSDEGSDLQRARWRRELREIDQWFAAASE